MFISKMILNKLNKQVRLLRFKAIYKKFKDFTMVDRSNFCTNLDLCNKFSFVKGSIVECGTWKGGMIGGIASLLGVDRNYFLFDSFEGLPPVQEIDGESAINWQNDKASPIYYDNCKVSEEYALMAMKISGASKVNIVKGWFNDTLANTPIDGGIAILRMDADWYQSTFTILDALFPKVNRGGLIIIDDYYTWDGCSRAIHDYLSFHKRQERIYSYDNKICYIIKR